jgi:hypothetical protein
MLKLIITMLLIGCAQTYAQDVSKKIMFAKGQQFEMVTTGESTTTMRRGKQVLTLKISSELTKLFDVKEVSDTGYCFNARISKMLNKMESQGNQIVYNSGQPADSNATDGAIKNPLINKVAVVFVNKKGVIVKTYDKTVAVVSDSSAIPQKNVTGMRKMLNNYTVDPQTVTVGNNFELVPYFSGEQLTKNHQWADTSVTDEGRQVINYTVAESRDDLITVSFTGDILRTDSSNDNDISEKTKVTGTLHGEIKIDPSSGTFISKTTNYEMQGAIQIMGVHLLTTVNNTITETVRRK